MHNHLKSQSRYGLVVIGCGHRWSAFSLVPGCLPISPVLPEFLDSCRREWLREKGTDAKWRQRWQTFILLSVNSWVEGRSQCFTAKAAIKYLLFNHQHNRFFGLWLSAAILRCVLLAWYSLRFLNLWFLVCH
jgi:hypothetical protein